MLRVAHLLYHTTLTKN